MLLLHTLLRRQLHDYVVVAVAVVVALVRVCNDKIVFSIYFLVNNNNKWISLSLCEFQKIINENWQNDLSVATKRNMKLATEIAEREGEKGR